MLLIRKCTSLLLLLASITTSLGIELRSIDTAPIKYATNVSYAKENSNPSGLASIFSPRMDFEQWKPLTGRGDPLRNDPTYDYEPPILERVHYWAEETRLEREQYPERKSEVLMLGVSSRKPSVTSRQPSPPPRRHQHRPLPPKYEDFTYKLSEYYPMTILVPPPPPPPGQQPSLFILSEEKLPPSVSNIKLTDPPKHVTKNSTIDPETVTSSYAFQEANLIYQSSTTNQNWIHDLNQTKLSPSNTVSSDYAGWGPTTPIDDNVSNDTPNFISNDHIKIELSKLPYSFYKPMLSESPPPPKVTASLKVLPTFLPTALPPTVVDPGHDSFTQVTWPTEQTTYEVTTENRDYYEEITTEKQTTIEFQPTLPSYDPTVTEKLKANFFDMLGPMMSMPMTNGPERPEDNLYAHASENVQVYQNQNTDDVTNLETMQTMQPPPPIEFTENKPEKDSFHVLNDIHFIKPYVHTHDPYLHMRYTTPIPTPTTATAAPEEFKSTTEKPTVPMYLIIQGHSKVKTYSSKTKPSADNHTISNEIPKPNETNEVKHLHPFKEKHAKKLDVTESRRSRAQNLKSLIDYGHGSIEIQDTDVGIKYDVSDGSNVPVEIYRKGLVDSDENNYSSTNQIPSEEKRTKRQIDLEDLLPFDEDTLENYVYSFLKDRRNETGITGLIAQAVTSDAANAVDDLEDEDDDSEQDDEER